MSEQSTDKSVVLNLIMFCDEQSERWVVASTELALVSSGGTQREAFRNFDFLVTAYLAIAEDHNTRLFHGVPPASRTIARRLAKYEHRGHVAIPTIRHLGRVIRLKESGQVIAAPPADEVETEQGNEGRYELLVCGR